MPIQECPLTIDAHQREVDRRGTPMFPCGGYATTIGQEANREIAWHWHDETEVLFVCSGTLLLELVGQRYEIHAGEGAFLNSGVPQAATAQGGDCEIHSLVFHPSLIAGMPESTLEQRYVRPLLACSSLPAIHFHKGLPWHLEAIQCIQQAFDACQKEPFAFELLVQQELSRLWYLIVSHYPDAIDDRAGANADALRVKEMLAYIHAHYADSLTLADIAKAASISERECLRCFKRTIGLSPMQYLLKHRISAAAGLLRETDWTITEISRQCGFESPSYFSLKFKSLLEISPKEYRASR
ncbi:AraC family transcriptional regulator [Clostridium sp. D33t1_170424_F3]|uniref:helix-turn-helix transcriptional regulator n=1 Tax=Clostridium sp. D33t1_170424_F3 TaxID=2787099 RepID=UPI0018AC3370|nr:AraC family transcriptional regulator [Clostridium sp. D33t1_170424_F3]